MRIKSVSAIVILALLVPSCASRPPEAIATGEDELAIQGHSWVSQKDPLTGQVTGRSTLEPVDGVVCTLSNDKGIWRVTTQGRVRVARSTRPIEIECAKEGYQTLRGSIPCVAPRQAASKILGSGEVALLVSPINWIFVPLLPFVVVTANSSEEKANLCQYNGVRKGVHVFLWREGESSWGSKSIEAE